MGHFAAIDRRSGRAVARAATSITADFAMAPAEFRQQVAEFAKLLSPSTVDALRDLAAGTSERPEICVSGLPVQADLPPPPNAGSGLR